MKLKYFFLIRNATQIYQESNKEKNLEAQTFSELIRSRDCNEKTR